jgi:hypothetical protein
MTAIRKGHDEHPCPLCLTRTRLYGLPRRAEIDLRLLAGANFNTYKALRTTIFHLHHKTPQGRVAARETVVVPKTLIDRHHLHTSTAQIPDHPFVSSGLKRLTNGSRLRHPLRQTPVQLLGAGHRPVEQTFFTRQSTILGDRLAGDTKIPGNRPLGLTGTQPAQELTNI